MALVWQFMCAWFDNKWTSKQGERPTAAWAFGLAGLTLEQLHAGFSALRVSGEKWPPSLTEFRALCEPRRSNNPAHVPVPRRLPVPPEERARQVGVAQAAVEDWKSKFPKFAARRAGA